MKKLVFIPFILLTGFLAAAGEEGPSSLEGEFIRQSNIRHLPVSYSTINGLSFDSSFQKDEVDEDEDDLFGDFTGLIVRVSPLAYGTFEKSKRLVSLGQGALNDFSIEAADENQEFHLIESKKWDLGGGAEVYAYLPGPLSMAGAGFALLKGKNYYSVRRLTHKNEKRAPLQIPLSSQDLSSWRAGDQLFYATRGGFIFNVYLGFRPFGSIGPEYLHSGSYRIRASLTGPQKMEIEITTTKTDSLGLEGMSLPAKFEFSKGKGYLNAIVYTFDLKHPQSLTAMAHLFHGRADLANREMLQSGGKISLSTQIEHTYSSVSGKYGIPIVYVSGGSSGTSHSDGTIERQGKEMDVFSSSHSKEYFTRGFLSSSNWYNETVTSTVLRDKDKDNSIITSSYAWTFSRDKMRPSNLTKKLARLRDVFGLAKLDDLRFPGDKLNYLKADFGISFAGSDVLHLLNTANLKTISEKALEKFEKDFTLTGHRAFCKVRSYNDCFNRHYASIEHKYQRLKTIASWVDGSYQEDQISDMTAQVNQAVNLLFSSRYLTQAFMAQRPSLNFELYLEGEKIKRHLFKL